MQARQKRTKYNMLMNGGTGFERINRKTNYIKSCREQKVEASHDRLRRERTQHIKKGESVVHFLNRLVKPFAVMAYSLFSN